MRDVFILFVGLFIFIGCNNYSFNRSDEKRAKFEPPDGKCILFIGQDLGAIGGVQGYSDGYLDHFEAPGGFTMYTNLRPGDVSFGKIYRGLDGIWETDNWGSGDCNMQLQVNDLDLKNSALAIGLELVNHEKAVARGEYDHMIDSLATWVKSLGKRPVFLRTGYEFDGHAWNHYDRESFVVAFKRVKDRFDSLHVENVAFVWQSVGWGTSYEEYEKWYPGDEYVDWCGYSFFNHHKEAKPLLDFAKDHHKPVFIAEATPVFDGLESTPECDFDNPEQAKKAWDQWFKQLFQTINRNPRLIKAVSYINVNWRVQDMWQNPPFSSCDTRIQASDYVSKNWQKEISKDTYLKASDKLFPILWNEK